MCALEAKCRTSVVEARRAVALLAILPLDEQVGYLINAVFDNQANIVRCCMEAKVSPDTRMSPDSGSGGLGGPVLILAAVRGHTLALNALLAGGADHRATDYNLNTALHYAADIGNVDIVSALLAAGADPHQKESLGNTPLMSAIMSRRTESAKALLPVSHPHLTNRQGYNALHACVVASHDEFLEILLPLMSGVDVRTVPGVDGHGRVRSTINASALHMAAHAGQQPLVKTLLSYGASRMARDSDLRLPLHMSAQEGHLAGVIALIGRPGKVKMTPDEVSSADKDGVTPLHLAASSGLSLEICGVLVQAGARLDAISDSGHTPLQVAQLRHPTNAALLALLSGAGPAALPGTVCDHCGKTAEQASVRNLKSCGACYGMRYCGAACSAAAWAGHKTTCKERVKEREKRTTVEVVGDRSQQQ